MHIDCVYSGRLNRPAVVQIVELLGTVLANANANAKIIIIILFQIIPGPDLGDKTGQGLFPLKV